MKINDNIITIFTVMISERISHYSCSRFVVPTHFVTNDIDIFITIYTLKGLNV